MSKNKPIVFIFAGNYNEYIDYLTKNKLLNRENYYYLHDRTQLLGRTDFKVIHYGTWYKRKNVSEIQNELVALAIMKGSLLE